MVGDVEEAYKVAQDYTGKFGLKKSFNPLHGYKLGMVLCCTIERKGLSRQFVQQRSSTAQSNWHTVQVCSQKPRTSLTGLQFETFCLINYGVRECKACYALGFRTSGSWLRVFDLTYGGCCLHQLIFDFFFALLKV